jgi:EspA/EspE family
MSVLDAFESAWSNARSTFGEGTPQTGAQYDSSGRLTELQNTVNSAAPDGRWTGTASNAYGNANQEHSRVLGQMAGLDQRLSAQVDKSAQVVAAGRQNLDTVRKWVMDAAASVPPGTNREHMLMPIVQKGLSELTDIVAKSNADLNKIGGEIRGIGVEFEALGNQKFGGLPEKGPGDGVPPPVDPKQAEHDVHQVLAGKASPEELARVRAGLRLTPEQQAAYNAGQQVELSGQQRQLLGQMRAQMHGMSIDDIRTAQERLGNDKNLISDSLQMMSSDKFQYAKVPLEVGAPGSLTETSRGGNGDQLPNSIKDVLSQPAAKTEWKLDSGFPTQITEYPTDDSLRKLAGIVQDGSPSMQQGTYLDQALLGRGSEILNGEEIQKTNPGMVASNQESHDPTAQDIFRAAGRDTIADHDILTGANGQTLLQNMSVHDWADNGAAASSLTNWVHDAASPNNSEMMQTRAGETAQAVANYLGDNGKSLLDIQTHPGGLNQGHTTIGEQNPDLVRGYANALEPFQRAMVGDYEGTHGFHALENTSSDMSKTRNLFAAIDSDPTAAKTFNAQAYQNVLGFEKDFANPTADGSVNDPANPHRGDIRMAGTLAGLIDGGADVESGYREHNTLSNAKQAYDLKKNALDFMFGLGIEQSPVVGGFIEAMGKDAVVEGLIGAPPETQPGGTPANFPVHSLVDGLNQAYYATAQDLVANDPNSGMPPEYMNGDKLKPPQDIPSDQIDSYYDSLRTYLHTRNALELIDNGFNTYYHNASGNK